MELVKNILNQLESNGEFISEKEYKYYTNIKFGDDCTEFEELSNCDLLVLKCKLAPELALLIMRIFQAVYENDFSNFENYEYITSDRGSIMHTLYESYDYLDPNQHMEYLVAYLYNNSDTQLEILDNGRKYIGNVNVYDSVPKINIS
jgi:hypothetical protein